jgi:hypothetical protein
MRLRTHRILLALGGLLVAIQLVPVRPLHRAADAPLRDVPGLVDALLRRACYDCHSAETVWPWYARVAPISWLLVHDVNEGREHLDFSNWMALGPRRRAKLLGEVVEDVESGEMPPWLYRVVHPEARLDERAEAALLAWARALREASQPPAP